MLAKSSFSKKKNISEPPFKNKKEWPIWINLIILAFPVSLYLLFQHLGSSIDFWIIGQKIEAKKGTNVHNAVAYMKQVKKVLQAVAISLGGAGVVLVAREYKQKNYEKAKQYAVLSFLIAIVSSLIVCFIFYLGTYLPGFFQNLFLHKEFHADGGLTYYNISLLTFVFITINAVFIGLERTKNKNNFILFLNVLNIILRVFFSFYYKRSVGVDNINIVHLAWADFFSNFIISLFSFYFMFNSKNVFKLQFNKCIFPKNIVKNILKLSGTLVIGKASYEIGKKFINDMVTVYYKDTNLMAITGYVAVVNGICYAVSQSLEDAELVMVSKKDKFETNKKTLKIFKNVFVITLIIGIIGVGVNQLFGEQLLKFLNNKVMSSEETAGFKTVLFFEQMSLFTSVWSMMMMIYIMSYKKSANIVVWLNVLRVTTRMFLIWFLHKFSSLCGDMYYQFGWSTGLSNIIVLGITIFLFVSFIKKQKEIETNSKEYIENK